VGYRQKQSTIANVYGYIFISTAHEQHHLVAARFRSGALQFLAPYAVATMGGILP